MATVTSRIWLSSLLAALFGGADKGVEHQFVGVPVKIVLSMHALIAHTGRVLAMLLTFAAVSCWVAVLHRVGEVALTARVRSLLERLRRASDARQVHRTAAT